MLDHPDPEEKNFSLNGQIINTLFLFPLNNRTKGY